jgi:hypothetical protein
MTTYFQVLTTLEYLLDKVGEKHWRDWLRLDVALWQSRKDVSHHLLAYGGMGSFNDVWISVQNGYNVTKMQEPWVNSLLDILKGLCFQLAHNPEIDEIIKDVNRDRYLPIVSAFKNNFDKKEMVNASHDLAMTISQLHGWRCLQCGHAETKPYEIEDFLANIFLPHYLGQTQTGTELLALVDSAFTFEFEGIDEARSQLRQTILNSGITIVERDGWMRPCPKCDSCDTVVYRWYLGNDIFVASKDNLPLKNPPADEAVT